MTLPDHYPATVDGLHLRKMLGRDLWGPARRYGPDGWVIERRDNTRHVLITAQTRDGHLTVTASIGNPVGMPTGDDLALLSSAVFGDRYGWRFGVVRDEQAGVLHLIGHTKETP
jgi:hypothetical protein